MKSELWMRVKIHFTKRYLQEINRWIYNFDIDGFVVL